jgi:large subunit ribosomal protein L19
MGERRLFSDLESLSNGMDLTHLIGDSQKKKKVAEFGSGDTVKVHSRVTEGNKERIQVFEGIVIERKHGGLAESFTVRRIAHGVGVERSFLIHSPRVEKIDVLRRGLVRRAKLFYLQDRVGSKATRIKEKK